TQFLNPTRRVRAERAAPAWVGPSVGAGDHVSPADAVGPSSACHLVWSRSAPPRPNGLLATRARLRLAPSNRSNARDGPQEQARARPTAKCLGATSSHPVRRPTVAATHSDSGGC